MTQALWGVLLLSLATTAQSEAERAAMQSDAPAVERRASPTQGRTGASVQKRTSSAPTSESYKAEMAECRRLSGGERSSCEREMRAAKAQGLYRE